MEEQKERKDKYDMSDVTDIQLEGSYGEIEKKCLACLDHIQEVQTAAGVDVDSSQVAKETLYTVSRQLSKDGIDLGLIIDDTRDGREQFKQAARYSWQNNNPNSFYQYVLEATRNAEDKFKQEIQFSDRQKEALAGFSKEFANKYDSQKPDVVLDEPSFKHQSNKQQYKQTPYTQTMQYS